MPDGGDRRALIERAFRAGIEVVAPDAAVKRVLRGTGDGFSVDGEAIPVRRRLLVVAIGKAAFYDQLSLGEPAAYARAVEVITANALQPDAQEGISAFLEKRAPRWTGP